MDKKNILHQILFVFLCFSSSVYAQTGRVGINTTAPQATLEIVAKTTDGSQAEGLIAPRLTGDQIKSADAYYGAGQNGMLVFATSAVSLPTTSKTVNITSSGYYYYDALNSVWMAVGSQATSSSASSVSVDCSVNGFVGNYTNGVALTGSNKFSVTVTNNTFTSVTMTFQTSDLVLSGVSGITVSSVSVPSVTLNSGQSQLVEYTLSGTPAVSGILSGTWTKLSLKCVKTVSVMQLAITSLSCGSATNNGSLTQGIAASGVSTIISYTGGNGSSYSAQTVNSTGVTGLTASLAAGSFSTGSGSLTYTINGTPSGAGTASFSINIGGQSCTFTRTVAFPITIPANITLAQNRRYLIVSIYDKDYLPYTSPTGSATTATQAADGVNESMPVNVQGAILPTGVTLSIPVTATGSGTLPAYSQTITIPASLTEDGISRDLTFSWTSQAYTSSTKVITATLKAVGGTLNAKKLDINSGIGNDALGVLLGQFTYPYNNAGNSSTYSIRDIAAIPDKMYGVADNTGSNTTHQMLYVPTIAEDGKTWLNNNLGAKYANINAAAFNPAQQATSSTDSNAYGSLFQWGRKPDGHELINWTSDTSGNFVNGTTTTLSNNPTDALIIMSSVTPWDWRVVQDTTLWATAASANNPCPSGFRVPRSTEIDMLLYVAGITSGDMAAASVLKFTFAGYRQYYNSSLSLAGGVGYYWSSTPDSSNNSYYLGIGSNSVNQSAALRSLNLAVRCIKD